jgi:molecular chaperone GrpE
MAADQPQPQEETVDGVHVDPAAEPAPPVDEATAEPESPAGADPAGDDQPEAEPDYKDLYLRAAAEAENVRKRARRDIESAHTRGVGRLVRELLPALDNFDRALAAAEAAEEDEEHHLTKGIRLVQQELLAALTRVGVEPYSPKGELFDPHQHEAVAQQPVEGVPSGTIVEVYQSGYRYNDDILRAAKVVVAA